jgi:taurine dioxygenase
MVLWDNWRMLHSAHGFPVDETGVAKRTTLEGDYALGRIMPGERAMTAKALSY